jgi:biopolymer transport protein ExbB/TolQ
MDVTFTPIFASALQFAFDKATPEGKVTIGALVILSLFSWTVIITKGRQLWLASRMTKKFYETFRNSRDVLELRRANAEFAGAPAFEVYSVGVEELEYHLKNNPVQVKGRTRISQEAFQSVLVVLERTVSAQAISLERGMIVLSTAVAGGPFIGLLGTVWGVMETFSGVAKANSANLTAMAPGVAGALIATVVGLLVAIPAMFAYNYMVTKIRGITQELDNFNSEITTGLEHAYVDNRALADEIADAIVRLESSAAVKLRGQLELESETNLRGAPEQFAMP